MVIPAGVEPAIFWMRTRRPRPLDDGTMLIVYILKADPRGVRSASLLYHRASFFSRPDLCSLFWSETRRY